MIDGDVIEVSFELDDAGLLWKPEIGDEIALREDLQRVSILVDPQGLTPSELRGTFLWLPTVEQLVCQFEARQALLYHAGINQTMQYEAVIKTAIGVIEARARSLRVALGKALKDIITDVRSEPVH